ncbi:hypothetical protein ACVWYG_002265 [Pedobacter sp. UYEF25]
MIINLLYYKDDEPSQTLSRENYLLKLFKCFKTFIAL